MSNPNTKTIERQSSSGAPVTERFPKVIGGVCESCGVIDGAYRAEEQYKLCRHYQGMQLRCSYCDPSKDPDEVIAHAELKVAAHPDNPDKLIVWCDSFRCSEKHLERFDTSR